MNRIKQLMVESLEVLILVTLGGVSLGTAAATYELNDFSPIPYTAIFYSLPLIIGIAVSIITRIGKSLMVALLSSLICGVVFALALSFPDLPSIYVEGELVTPDPLKQVIPHLLYLFPLLLVGVFMGKFFAEE